MGEELDYRTPLLRLSPEGIFGPASDASPDNGRPVNVTLAEDQAYYARVAIPYAMGAYNTHNLAVCALPQGNLAAPVQQNTMRAANSECCIATYPGVHSTLNNPSAHFEGGEAVAWQGDRFGSCDWSSEHICPTSARGQLTSMLTQLSWLV